MTLLIGIKCKEALVMASDSQITTGTSKRTDSTKMELVEFQMFPVMVAQSGSLIHSNRFVDIFRQEARGVEAKNADDIAKIATSAMRKVKAEIREERFGVSADELDLYLLREGLQVGIMIGFFLNNKPEILTVNLAFATCQQSRNYYEADGCGATLGEYLIAESAAPEMDLLVAAGLAIYVVEQVKKHDSACGGPTKVGVLKNTSGGNPSVGHFEQAGIDQCAAVLTKLDIDARPKRKVELNEALLNDDCRLNENFHVEWSFG